MEGDVAPLPEIAELCERFGARLMVDEAHALGVLGARGAGTCELLGVEDRVDLRMATFSKSLASCGGVIAGPADVIEFLRIQSRPFMFTASGVPAAVGAALAAVRICRSDEGRELFARVLDNARYLHRGLSELGLRVVEPPRGWPTAPRSSRRSSRSSSATTGRPCCCGRRSTSAGVFVNTAMHPAVPPGGALLRTSVMATHDHATLDQALEIFAAAKREFEAEHGPLPGPPEPPPPTVPSDGTARSSIKLSTLHKRDRRRKNTLLARRACSCDLAVTEPVRVGFSGVERWSDRAAQGHSEGGWPGRAQGRHIGRGRPEHEQHPSGRGAISHGLPRSVDNVNGVRSRERTRLAGRETAT